MKVPLEWLRDVVTLPADITTEAIADRLTAFDLTLEEIVASGISGPLTVGRVLSIEPEEQKNGKTINWCSVDVGEQEPRGIVCGAHNFAAGDLVVVSLPGTVLPALAQYIPGGVIAARKTYGHVSDGMICSEAELGLSPEQDGIIVLDPDAAAPGDSAITVLGLDEDVIDLEVNPDRAYALSLRGVGRDTALAFSVPFDDPANIAVSVDGASYPVVVEDAEACPVFTAREVTGFDPARPTPAWMARRIEQAGMRSISLAVDVSNYVMLELGQPNHAYDKAKLQGAISVRRAKPGEAITTLDDVERTLDPDDVVICDDRGPIGIGGVMGGAEVEIDGSTTDIVIECAYFDPPVIARSARRHKLPSEASKRFERGVDPQLAARASQRVADLLVEFGGGTISSGLTVVGDAPARPAVTVALDLPARVTGVDIDPDTVVSALTANGIEVTTSGDQVVAVPPSWRFDLNDPYDVVEEVLRVVGYDQVPSILPAAPAGRGLTKAQQLRRRAGFVLAGEGLVEVKTFPFAGPADFDRLGFDANDLRRRQVLLENPLSAEEPGMATTLLVGLLKAAALNIGRGHSDVALVETARVFAPGSAAPDAPIYGVETRPSEADLAVLDAALPAQPWHIGFVLVGNRDTAGWQGPARAVSWADAVDIVRAVAESFHVDIAVEAADVRPWHPGRTAAIVVAPSSGSGQATRIGHAGEVHPRVAREWGLPERSVAAEINLDALIAAAPALGPRPTFSSFPVAKEDLAFVVDDAVTAESVRTAVSGASELIETVRLFDVYTGDQVGEGRRSLAFALRLRAADRTLTEDDIRGAREAAIGAAAALGATLRA